jgi:hypothetical protein
MKPICSCLIFSLLPFCSRVTGQVPLRDEPYHKAILENEYVRLIDGRVPARDTTLMHLHAANSIVVFLSKSAFGIQNAGEKPTVTEVKPGDVVYRAYGDNPVNHKVWSADESLFHFWVIELVKQRLGDDTCSTLSSSHAELQWQKKLVRAFKLSTERGEHINLPKSNCAYLVMNISGVISLGLPGSNRLLQADDFFFFSPRTEIKIKGTGNGTGACVLLELK